MNTTNSEKTFTRIDQLEQMILTYQKLKKIGSGNAMFEKLIHHPVVERHITQSIARFENFYGMPEFANFEQSYYHDGLVTAAMISVEKAFVDYYIDDAVTLALDKLKRIGAFLGNNLKHTLMDTALEFSKEYYPLATRYYQESLILAHKGGIHGYIANCSIEEVYEAINYAKRCNNEKTTSARIQKAKRRGQFIELYEVELITYNQCAELMKVYALAPGYTPRYEDEVHKKIPKTAKKPPMASHMVSASDFSLSYNDVMRLIEKVSSNVNDRRLLNDWFEKLLCNDGYIDVNTEKLTKEKMNRLSGLKKAFNNELKSLLKEAKEKDHKMNTNIIKFVTFNGESIKVKNGLELIAL